MPPRRYNKRKPAALRRKRMGRPRRGMTLNPKPIFTETFRHSTLQITAGFASTVLGVSIDSVPQLSQYSNLYSRYRILRAQWIVMPCMTSYDLSTLPFANSYQACPRVVYAINDTAPPTTSAPVAPVNEQAILQDNGCKIRQGNKPIKFSNRPVPQTIDSLNVVSNLRGKFITFSTGPNTTHWGVALAISNQFVTSSSGATVEPAYVVYCKVTFQLADPR